MEFMEYREPIELFIDDKSALDYGIKTYSSNILSSPARKLEFIEIEGRKNGSLTIDNGYEDFILKLECVLVNENKEETMSDLARRAKNFLLSCNNCKIRTSEDIDFYLVGTYTESVDIEEAIANFGIFQAQFRCKPYRYSENETNIEITEQNTTINNSYCDTDPVIVIIGSGDITLKINSQQLILKDVEDTITINCQTMNAEKISSLNEVINQNQKMYSDFPVIESGNNTISWILGENSSLTKINISFREAVI